MKTKYLLRSNVAMKLIEHILSSAVLCSRSRVETIIVIVFILVAVVAARIE